MSRRPLAGALLTAALAAAALPGAAVAASAPVPADYDRISRELRIGADVLRAALADAVPGPRRVVDTEAGYLAGQGVLVIVEMTSPWFRIREDGEPDFTSLERIPDLVQEILRELDVGLSRRQVEELEELHEIREAQRAVRAEQRALRGQLREKRRQLQGAGDGDAAEALREQMAVLEADLAAAEAEERALEQDAATVRETLERPQAAAGEGTTGVEGLDLAVAESICSYGAAFKFLEPGQHLNVLVRQTRSSRYFVFVMADVRACQAGDLTAEGLLAKSYVYGS